MIEKSLSTVQNIYKVEDNKKGQALTEALIGTLLFMFLITSTYNILKKGPKKIKSIQTYKIESK